MSILVRCHYRLGGAQERLGIRDVHLRFMIAGRPAIQAGGALVGPDGEASGMFLLLACDSVAEAEAFLELEPYTAAGLFSSRSFEQARRFIPSDTPDLLEAMLAEVEVAVGSQRAL